jgi:hypothetical protein
LSPKQQSQVNINDFNADLKVVAYELTQVPFVNRCFRVFSDLKARNFFALQYHPNTNMQNYPIEAHSEFNYNMQLFFTENVTVNRQESLYSNSYSQDFNDIQFKYHNATFGLHKFIVYSRCSKIFTKLEVKPNSKLIEVDSFIGNKFNLKTFELVINYVYTNEFQSELFRQALKASKVHSEATFIKFLNEFRELAVDKFGFTDLKSSLESSNYSKSLKELNLNAKEDRIELMVEFFCRIMNNSKRKAMKLSRSSYKELYDCKIECNNDQIISCHKCVLVARSEFFRNMFLGSWIESSSSSIKLPFDADLMQIIIDFLYTDEILIDFIHSSNNTSSSIKSKNEREIEVLFNLYVLSDQLLLERLKNLCEFKLANLVNLKNVAEILGFSQEYEARQLKDFCMEFICLNLVTLIDAKQLESLDMSLLNDLSAFYRLYFPLVSSRMITPYSDGLDPEKIELVPLDMLYDQKFIDGEYKQQQQQTANQSNSPPPSTSVSVLSQNTKVVSNSDEFKEDSANSLSITESLSLRVDDVSNEVTEETHQDQKWERVKKKNRRKIPEKEDATPKQATPPVGAFFSEKDGKFIIHVLNLLWIKICMKSFFGSLSY